MKMQDHLLNRTHPLNRRHPKPELPEQTNSHNGPNPTAEF